MSALPRAALPLLLGGAFAASQPHVAVALPLRRLCKSMPCADFGRIAGLTPVHPSMLGRINQFNVVWPTASMCAALMMHMLMRRFMQSFINETMHFSQNTIDADVAIATPIS